MLKHGLTNTNLYKTFTNMKQRCYNPRDPKYAFYGEKGISICGEWLDNFKVFYDWAMSNGYQDGLTIDRIDSNENYSPDNCRWIPMHENVMRRWRENKPQRKAVTMIALRQEREKRNWTLQFVANSIGKSKSFMHDIENGRRTGSVEVWDALEDLFSISQRKLRETAKDDCIDI